MIKIFIGWLDLSLGKYIISYQGFSYNFADLLDICTNKKQIVTRIKNLNHYPRHTQSLSCHEILSNS